jgi:hypothetical protein
MQSVKKSHTISRFSTRRQAFSLCDQEREEGEWRDLSRVPGFSGCPQPLLTDISNAWYAPASSGDPAAGYLLFARGQALMAQRFSARNSNSRARPSLFWKKSPERDESQRVFFGFG